MTCTIIISHFNSLPFLHTCIRQIRKHEHPEVYQHIIIADQSSDEVNSIVRSMYGNDPYISVVKIDPLYSGYGIDYIMRYVNIETDYVCQLHVDAFPINKNWLKMSLTLMEENDFKFVGVLQFICNSPEPIYYFNKPFFAMAQSFNIGRTEVYKEMSEEAGFTRYHQRRNIKVPMTFKNDDWDKWAKEDYDRRGSDDDVVAFCWQDNHMEHDKLGFGITGKMGIHGEESGYGSIIEDMVFHFGFCRESIGVMTEMGKKYQEWTRRINENYDDALIEEMLSVARSQPFDPVIRRMAWNGKTKVATYSPHSINKRINELKQS